MSGQKESAQSTASTPIPALGEPRCSLCNTDLLHRMERQGLLERWLYPVFGFYPWRCEMCRTKIYLHKRKRPGDTGRHYSE